MRTHLWTWNYTCVISPWESTEIKTKTISRSVFSSQILQNAEMNIIVHWKFWRKYGSVSHLFSCNKTWIQFKNALYIQPVTSLMSFITFFSLDYLFGTFVNSFDPFIVVETHIPSKLWFKIGYGKTSLHISNLNIIWYIFSLSSAVL